MEACREVRTQGVSFTADRCCELADTIGISIARAEAPDCCLKQRNPMHNPRSAQFGNGSGKAGRKPDNNLLKALEDNMMETSRSHAGLLQRRAAVDVETF